MNIFASNFASNRKTEILKDNIKLFVSDNHYFGSDAILLADFAQPKMKDIILDLGTGCGIIPMLWACENPEIVVDAIDIQQDAVELATASVNEAGFNINVKLCDLKNLEQLRFHNIAQNKYTLITMNPPFFANGKAILNPSQNHSIARHEGEGCSFSDVALTVSKLLQFGGRFCFCHRPDRLPEIFEILKNYNLEPKKLRFAHLTQDKAPWLFLCEARRGGNPELTVLPPFISCDNINNEHLDEYKRLYKWYLKPENS